MSSGMIQTIYEAIFVVWSWNIKVYLSPRVEKIILLYVLNLVNL